MLKERTSSRLSSREGGGGEEGATEKDLSWKKKGIQSCNRSETVAVERKKASLSKQRNLPLETELQSTLLQKKNKCSRVAAVGKNSSLHLLVVRGTFFLIGKERGRFRKEKRLAALRERKRWREEGSGGAVLLFFRKRELDLNLFCEEN